MVRNEGAKAMIDIDSGLELEHNDPDLLMYKDTFVDLSNSNSVNLSKYFDHRRNGCWKGCGCQKPAC